MLKCVMYFSEYILKYIISKVKKKKSLSPSPWIFLSHRCLEVLGTKVTGMVRAEHSGVRQKVKDPANTGGGVHTTPASRLLLWYCWWELALEKCLRLLSPLSLTPSQQRRGTLSETDRSSGQVLSSSTLGIQDAGLLLPCWCWGWVSRMKVFWVFTVHPWRRRRSKPVSASSYPALIATP